jgi:hypothetical protein
MNDLPTLTEHFHQILAAAQIHRHKRDRRINGAAEWITFERQVMFDAVNKLRPTTMERLKSAERCAVGHSDYSHKFALHCAELVLE